MENILTNMSIGGLLIVLLTTLRITFKAELLDNASRLSQFIQDFIYKTHRFFLQSYKPFTVLVLSGFVLFVCYKITGDRHMSMWVSAAMGGILSIGITAVAKSSVTAISTSLHSTHNGPNRTMHAWLDEKHIGNSGTLFICLLSLLAVLLNYQTQYTWNSFAVLSLAASFAAGGSGLLLCMHVYELFASNPVTFASYTGVSSSSNILSNDRFDALIGTLVAAMLLGTTLCEITTFQKLWLPASPVILPLALAISGVGISSVAATLAKINGWTKDPIAYLSEKMISAVLMIITAFVITQSLLPSFWVCNGTEYTSMQVFYAAQAGIISGLLTNKVVQGYHALHRKYFSYLAKKSFRVSIMDSLFHMLINSVSALLPVVLIILAVWVSYSLVGLYGIVIALIAMLANISTQLIAGK